MRCFLQDPAELAVKRASLPVVVRAGLWMAGTSLMLSIMIGVIRHLSVNFSTFEILFFRNSIGIALILPWVLRAGAPALRTARPGLQLLRVCFTYVAMLSWFYAAGLIPLADTIALKFTEPMFTTLGAVLLLGERSNPRRWAATAVGFIGMMVILRPGVEALSVPALLVLLSAVCYASASLTIKTLSRTDRPNTIVLYGLVLMLPLSALPAAFTWSAPGWADAPWLLALGATGIASQLCLTRALAAVDASVATPFLFLQLPFSAAIALIFFAEPLDPWTWAGAAIIFAGTLFLAHSETRATRAG